MVIWANFCIFLLVVTCFLFRHSDGVWNVPCVGWGGSSFNRNGNWLDNSWNSNCRVVALDTLSFFLPVTFCIQAVFLIVLLFVVSTHITYCQFLRVELK